MYDEVAVFIIKNLLRTAGISRERYFQLLEEVWSGDIWSVLSNAGSRRARHRDVSLPDALLWYSSVDPLHL